jgi:hypothetical protein
MELIDQKNNLFLEGIKEINKQQNFLDYIIILFYNFFKKILSLLSIHNIYHTRFLIDNLKLKNNNHLYKSVKNVHIYFFDDSIYINNFKIPYEYIIYIMQINNNNIYIVLFGNISSDDSSKINLELSEGIVELLFTCDNPLNIIKIIKKNMYYHIKYNKINENSINYFLNYLKTKKD